MSALASSIALPGPEPGWFDVAFQVLENGHLARLQADFDVLTHQRAIREQASSGAARSRIPPQTVARVLMFDGAMTDGDIRWSRDPFAAGSSGYHISDCATLNVCGDDVWSCFETGDPMVDFPLVRFRGRVEDAWTTSLFLVQAIAVDGVHVAAITQACGEPYRISLLHLVAGAGVVLGETNASTFGIEPAPRATVLGRGSALHGVTDGRWLTLNVSQMRAYFELEGPVPSDGRTKG